MFAAPTLRAPLLGVYALMAEWRTLMDPATQADVARIKLAWWHEELNRLRRRAPVHPITRYLAELPGAAGVDFAPLSLAVEAALVHVAGAPLEHGDELDSHANALYGLPLQIVVEYSATHLDSRELQPAVGALATAQYLARAIADYRRDAALGRTALPVNQLLAAAIENEDLLAVVPPPRLLSYLAGMRETARRCCQAVATAIPVPARSLMRHLCVSAVLTQRHLQDPIGSPGPEFRATDVIWAWRCARRAVAGR